MNLDPRTTALVLIDLQNGVLGRTLVPHPARGSPGVGDRARRAIPAAGAVIVWVRVCWSPDLGDALRQPVDQPPHIPPGGFPPDFAGFPEGLVEPVRPHRSPSGNGGRSTAPSSTSSSADAACGRSSSAGSPPTSASNRRRATRGNAATRSSSRKTSPRACPPSCTTSRCGTSCRGSRSSHPRPPSRSRRIKCETATLAVTADCVGDRRRSAGNGCSSSPSRCCSSWGCCRPAFPGRGYSARWWPGSSSA